MTTNMWPTSAASLSSTAASDGIGLPRDDQQMRRRLRIDIANGEALLIFEDNFGRNLAIDDLLKIVLLVMAAHWLEVVRSCFRRAPWPQPGRFSLPATGPRE